EGMLKLLFNPEDGKLLGVHIIGEDATEIIHIGISTMYYGGTIDCFIQSVFNFPTLSEMYKYAAYDGLGRLARSGRTTQAGKFVERPMAPSSDGSGATPDE